MMSMKSLLGEIRELPIDQVEPNNYNPNVLGGEKYEALKADVKEGNYDPILVSPKDVFYGEPIVEERFVIVDGEFRWRAGQDVGAKTIKAEIQHIAICEARTITYKRDRERGELDPFKEAQLFDQEVKDGLTEEEVAERYGVTRSYVAGKRMLLKSSAEVKALFYKPETTLKERARPRIHASIEEHAERWKIDKTKEEIDAETEEQLEDIVPRGTLTSGHMKAIAGLPPEYQNEIAEEIVHGGLTVRDAEEKAKQARDKIEKQKRLQEALKKARQPTCPRCGAKPTGFSHNEDRFYCSNCYQSWDYMVTKKELEEQRKKREDGSKDAKSEQLKRARENPAYVRRLEPIEKIDALIRPWILRKLHELDSIEEIDVVGFRGDKAVKVEYPSYHNSLIFQVGPKEKKGGEWWRRWNREFHISMEAKDYKTLEEKSKLDLHVDKVGPDKRAEVHRFLDEIVHTDEDPFLPENETERQAILAKYEETQ